MERLKFFPIKILLGFLIFTEVLLFVGPINYEIEYPGILIVFLAIVNICLYKGYCHGVRKYRSYNNDLCKSGIDISLRTYNWFILLGLLSFAISYSRFNLSEIPHLFITGLTDSVTVYKDKLETEGIANMWIFIVNQFLAPIKFGAICFGIYMWKRLPVMQRSILVVFIVLEVVYWICLGTRKGLLDIIIMILVPICIANPALILKKNVKMLRRLKVGGGILLALFVVYFILSNMSRYNVTELQDMDDVFNLKPFYIAHSPVWLNIAFANIEGYLCQGYFALSKALNSFIIDGYVPWSCFLGSNWFTINVFEYIDPSYDVLANTYMHLLDVKYGIDPAMKWHSLYVWLANDVTFVGVPVVIYLIGKWFGELWMESVFCRNIYAVPLCVVLAMIIIYAFANNQMLSFSFTTVCLYTVVYLLKKINFKFY